MAPLLAVGHSILIVVYAGTRIAPVIARASEAHDVAEIITTSRANTAAAAATGEDAPKIREPPYDEYDSSTNDADAAATDRLEPTWDANGSGSEGAQLTKPVPLNFRSDGQIDDDNDAISREDFTAWHGGGGGGGDTSEFADRVASASLVAVADDDKRAQPLTSKISPSVLDHAGAGAAVTKGNNGRGGETDPRGILSGHSLDTGTTSNHAKESSTDYNIPLGDYVAQNTEVAGMIAVETIAEAEEMCGEGRYRKACSKGGGCCNSSSCDISCAIKGEEPCPHTACGEPGSGEGGSSKVRRHVL